MKLSRFERKILFAIAAVAVVPLLGALLLGQRALREAYQVGVNPRVQQELQHNLTLYRDHFVLLKQSANQLADAVASDHALILAASAADAPTAQARIIALLKRSSSAARIRVLDKNGNVFVQAEDPQRLGPDMRLLELTRVLTGLEAPHAQSVTMTVATRNDRFLAYQRAGELVEVYARLESEGELISTFYLVVYMGFLLSVIVAALAVGVLLSRRVTRRVSLLADATARVGAGDLDVQVPTAVNDEIGELTKAFNAMVRDLRDSRGRIEYLQRISAWQDFARRLAHEIKNPLTPIQLAVQEVHRRYDGSDVAYRKRLDETLSIVEEEVATLRRLVTEFSAFAKLPQASLAPADLGEFVRDAARTLSSVPDECEGDTPVSVEPLVLGGALPVAIDAMMLKRAVDNLVRNAVQAIRADATRKGGRVRVQTIRQGECVLLEVADDGPGVDPHDRVRIFDPYHTTKPEGSGLGLAIVKKVVLEHHGEIECRQSDLGGAAFTISLPLRA